MAGTDLRVVYDEHFGKCLWDDELMCFSAGWQQDGNGHWTLRLATGSCCDMTGAITQAERLAKAGGLDQPVRIQTWSGPVKDTLYVWSAGKWEAHLPSRDARDQMKPGDIKPVTVAIKGYRQLSEEEQRLINLVKSEGAVLESLIAALRQGNAADPWLTIGKTHLQQGLMALTRAVAKPEGF